MLTNLRGESDIAETELSRMENIFKKQQEVTAAFGQVSVWKHQSQIMTRGTFIRPCLVLTSLMTICSNNKNLFNLDLYK